MSSQEIAMEKEYYNPYKLTFWRLSREKEVAVIAPFWIRYNVIFNFLQMFSNGLFIWSFQLHRLKILSVVSVYL